MTDNRFPQPEISSGDFLPNKLQVSEQALMQSCTLCPRNCHADRISGETGYCGQTDRLTAARASLHFWEEPCLSGKNGSGTVFFSGCNLRCVYCQNHNIALGKRGREITSGRLSEIFLKLQEKGAHNINLVTPTHFVPQIRTALIHARETGLSIPVVYNTGSYEYPETLRMLDGLVDIYLPDLKYQSSALSKAFSNASDYFPRACDAIAEMFRQTGAPVFDASGSLMQRGVIVRHLLLPGQTGDSKRIIRYLHNTYGSDIYISIMSQYTPLPQVSDLPELNRTVTEEEYQRVVDFARRIGVTNGYVQEGAAASESFIPDFDGEGL